MNENSVEDDENLAGISGGLSSSASTAVAGIGGVGVLGGVTLGSKRLLDAQAKKYREWMPEKDELSAEDPELDEILDRAARKSFIETDENPYQSPERPQSAEVTKKGGYQLYNEAGVNVGETTMEPRDPSQSAGAFAKYLTGKERPILESRERTVNSPDSDYAAIIERGRFSDGTIFEVMRGPAGVGVVLLRAKNGRTFEFNADLAGLQKYRDGKGYEEAVSKGSDRFLLTKHESRLMQVLDDASSKSPRPNADAYRQYQDEHGGGEVVGGDVRDVGRTFGTFTKYFDGSVKFTHKANFGSGGRREGDRYRFDDGTTMNVWRDRDGVLKRTEVLTRDGRELVLDHSLGTVAFHDGKGYSEKISEDSTKWTRPSSDAMKNVLPEVDLSSSEQADAESEDSTDDSGTESHLEADESPIPGE